MQWTTTSRVLMVTGLVGVAGVRRRRLRREPVIGRRRRAATPAPPSPVAPAILSDDVEPIAAGRAATSHRSAAEGPARQTESASNALPVPATARRAVPPAEGQ